MTTPMARASIRLVGLAILLWPRAPAADPPGEVSLVEVAIRGGEDGFDAVAADPASPRRLWAASGARVLVSDDGGRSWHDSIRLPGPGASDRNGTADGAAGGGVGREIEEGLDDEATASAEAELDGASAARRADTGSEGGPTDERENRRIHGLRASGDQLWIAAADGAYRWSPESGGGRLERFAMPGEAAVVAVAPETPNRGPGAPEARVPEVGPEPPVSLPVASFRAPGIGPDPGGPARVWLATTSGLWRIDGVGLSRVPGAVGITPARDVDVRRVGGTTRVAVASDAGLFLSSDGGLSFDGPLPVDGPGSPAAAVRLLADGSGLAITREGVLGRFDQHGIREARPVSGLGRGVTRLHVAGEPGEDTEAPDLPPATRERPGIGAAPQALATGPEHRLWIGTEAGLFLVPGGGPGGGATGGPWPRAAVPVTRGLAASLVRDVVTPMGRPDRPLVATDRGLFLGVGPGQIPRWRAAPWPAGLSVARLAAGAEAHLGLPDLDVGGLALAPLLPRVDASYTARPPELGRRRDTWAVIARWDLARLFGPGENLAVSAAERRLVRARRSLQLRIERVVRARNRLVAQAETGPVDVVDMALARLAVEEQTARLDGWTGGRFSEARDGAVGNRGTGGWR